MKLRTVIDNQERGGKGAIKIIIGRNNGQIEKGVVLVRKNGNALNAISKYGTELQAAYGDIAGISHSRGYCWVGHSGNTNACPNLLNWTDLTRPELDAETWNIL